MGDLLTPHALDASWETLDLFELNALRIFLFFIFTSFDIYITLGRFSHSFHSRTEVFACCQSRQLMTCQSSSADQPDIPKCWSSVGRCVCKHKPTPYVAADQSQSRETSALEPIRSESFLEVFVELLLATDDRPIE